MRKRTTVIIAALVLGQLGATQCGRIIDDSGFQLWCGEELCLWKLERGQIRPAPTWHSKDVGVELVGDDVAISQPTDVNSSDGACIRFEVIADIEETAIVTLEMDVFDDGVVDYSQVLPTARWEPLSYRILLETPYQHVRFRLSKRGAGRAVLAQIEATIADECPDRPIALPPRERGADCVDGDDCASGVCMSRPTPGGIFGIPFVCSTCASDADCAGGEVCGIAEPERLVFGHFRACVPPASRSFGEVCAVDGECTTGVCCDGMCSTCCEDEPCPDGRACATREPIDGETPHAGPNQCNPRRGQGVPGEPCLSHADCASGSCAGDGELRVCFWDGRKCNTDSDCPGGSSGECAVLGSRAATCE